MKKYIAFTIAFLMLLSICSGCKKTYDVDGTIQKLKDKGMTVSENYDTPEKLEGVNTALNEEIEANGGNFSVTLKQMTHFIYGDDLSQTCQIFVFENTQQAKNMTEFYLSLRGEENYFNVAHSANVMIATNLDFVQSVVGLKFS